MAKRDPTADLLRELRALERDPRATDAEAILKIALASPIGIIVTRAAPLVAAGGWRFLVPDLEKAFEFFRLNPERDQDSVAKVEIVLALSKLGVGDQVTLEAVYHVQLQYGEFETEGIKLPADGGMDLRSVAIIALAERGHPRAGNEAVRLLLDPYPPVREAAVNAMTAMPLSNAHLPLRLMALGGEREPSVLAALFKAIIATDVDGVDFVFQFLNGADVQKILIAALALGETGREDVLPSLIDAWSRHRELKDEVSRTLLLSIATLRLDGSFVFLLDVLRDGNQTFGQHALEALQMHRRDDAACERIREAAQDSGVEALIELTERLFPEP